MRQVLSRFRKAFKIAPATLKEPTKDEHYKYKMLVIYLLTKYSHEEYAFIAKEFHATIETIELIALDTNYDKMFEEERKLFFREFEDEYLLDVKTTLSLQEKVMLNIN
ncbi:hypothetical protein MLC52_05425 [Sulfurimonas sp. NW15]|uniref:hypothetical protein n=1 Tax=Sulfurimonas sp. NW15 TaxID=2922729 RepID=UPI003DA81382